jgi:hypothetical protein
VVVVVAVVLAANELEVAAVVMSHQEQEEQEELEETETTGKVWNESVENNWLEVGQKKRIQSKEMEERTDSGRRKTIKETVAVVAVVVAAAELESYSIDVAVARCADHQPVSLLSVQRLLVVVMNWKMN